MSEELSHLIDFDLAWKRAKLDIPDRVFVRHPFEQSLIELNLEEWLTRIKEDVKSRTYHPHSLMLCDVPKGRGAVRPGSILRLSDAVMYAALVGACLPNIYQSVQWSQQTVDFSYTLSESHSEPQWIVPEIGGWKTFQEDTLRRIDEGVAWVIFADISAYYENIDISRVISDLRGCGAERLAVDELSAMLNRWAQVTGRGLPQGHAPSDILAKLYLNSVDLALVERGYQHARYVDDFRFYCSSEAEAKRALLEVTTILRRLGLNLHTSKTEILTSVEARAKIDAITAKVKEVRLKFLSQISDIYEMGDPYLFSEIPLEVVNDDPLSSPDSAPLVVIQEAYEDYIIGEVKFTKEDEREADRKFDKTLFHYLLNRLAREADPFAVVHCLSLLSSHPEETKYICRYLLRTETVSLHEKSILSFLQSEDSIYSYQVYQLIEVILDSGHRPQMETVAFVRQLAFDGSRPPYLRAVCRQFIGQYGSQSDLDRLEAEYSGISGDIEQCEVLCSLKRMEVSRRNSFLGRLSRDSDWHERAKLLIRRD